MLVPAGLREKHATLRTEYLKNPTARPMGAGLELHGVHKDGTTIPSGNQRESDSNQRGRGDLKYHSRRSPTASGWSRPSRQAAVLRERNRLAREVHDSLAQGLTSIVLQLEGAEDVLTKDSQEAQKHIVRARTLARSSLAETRRSLVAMHAPILHETSLPDTIEQVISDLRQESSARIELVRSWKPTAPVSGNPREPAAGQPGSAAQRHPARER